MSRTVQDFLGASPTARIAARLELGGRRTVTIWENRDDRVLYETPAGHTFSFYLEGGTGTRRLDAGAVAGWPGAVCILPEGQGSAWEITAPFRFVHLYLPDDALRAAYAMTHDCDARRLEVRDVTFAALPEIGAPLRRLALAAEAQDRLAADGALAELVGALPARRLAVKGGLSPLALRRIDDWIEAHLEGPIRLADLAALAGLSEFHVQRMFRLCRGVSPHGWVTQRRIARAQALLRGPEPLAGIAAACGFSSQSHFTRVFGRETGLTPAAYRAGADLGGLRR
ncbi:AraC family transcriptional regulator [Rhodobacteraceae bacterium DSL-40]|uniref:helix-turn-helix transcriptional regulator n=1 Tax=Amaricoccus sp. B4 TaxID=3368557 RepID=UPI000DAE48C9